MDWQRRRRHFCFLPLQISHFDTLGSVGNYLSGGGAASEHPAGRITDEGDILISRRAFGACAERLRQSMTIEDADRIRQQHRQRLSDLVGAGRLAASSVQSQTSADRWAKTWTSLSSAISALAPYGLVTKVLPDVLLDRIGPLASSDLTAFDADSGDDPLGLRMSSHSLVDAVHRLIADLSGRNDQRLRDDLINAFCRRQAGFGPSAWEAAGYENPDHVRAIVDQQLQPRIRTPWKPPIPEGKPQAADSNSSTWVSHLRYWTLHLDSQTTILRWAFLTFSVPMLRTLAKQRSMPASDLLYMTRHEIPDDLTPARVLKERREAYRSLVVNASRSELEDAPIRRMEPPGPRTTQNRPPTGPTGQRADGMRERSLDGVSASTARRVRGWARIIDGQTPTTPSSPGTVVVAAHLSPDLTPALIGASAVVVEETGLLQHAAILAREMGIPCIVACTGLLDAVFTGATLTVDGRNGSVTIEREGQPTR